MESVVRARLVRIGNSRGVRIPKIWLEQLGLKDEVATVVHKDMLIIRKPTRPRQGWAEAFQAMASHKDDILLDDLAVTRWDVEEWEW